MIGSLYPASSYPGGQTPLATAEAAALVGTAALTVTAAAVLTDAVAAELVGTASLSVTASAVLTVPVVDTSPAISAIDRALVAMLGSDTTLLSYMPDGVYWANEAPPGATRFVEVSVQASEHPWVFSHRAYDSLQYLVTAVMRSTAGTKAAIVAAEARIDALLDGQVVGLGVPPTVAGYTYMSMARERRFPPESAHDAADPSIHWWRRGGYYRVEMARTEVAA